MSRWWLPFCAWALLACGDRAPSAGWQQPAPPSIATPIPVEPQPAGDTTAGKAPESGAPTTATDEASTTSMAGSGASETEPIEARASSTGD